MNPKKDTHHGSGASLLHPRIPRRSSSNITELRIHVVFALRQPPTLPRKHPGADNCTVPIITSINLTRRAVIRNQLKLLQSLHSTSPTLLQFQIKHSILPESQVTSYITLPYWSPIGLLLASAGVSKSEKKKKGSGDIHSRTGRKELGPNLCSSRTCHTTFCPFPSGRVKIHQYIYLAPTPHHQSLNLTMCTF